MPPECDSSRTVKKPRRKRGAPDAPTSTSATPAAPQGPRAFNKDKADGATAKRRRKHQEELRQLPEFLRLWRRHCDNNRVFLQGVPLGASEGELKTRFFDAAVRPLLAPAGNATGESAALPSADDVILSVSLPRVSPPMRQREASHPGKVKIYAFIELKHGSYHVIPPTATSTQLPAGQAEGGDVGCVTRSQDFCAAIAKRCADQGVAVPVGDALCTVGLPAYREPFEVLAEEEEEGGCLAVCRVEVSSLGALNASDAELAGVLRRVDPAPLRVVCSGGAEEPAGVAGDGRRAHLDFLSREAAEAVCRSLDGTDYSQAAVFGRCDPLRSSAVLKAEIVPVS